MKRFNLISLGCVLIAFAFASLIVGSSVFAKVNSLAMLDSKTLPEKITLAKDSQDDKYGEVAFNHQSHSFNKYSRDGKTDITCTECHHTDQPAAALKPPYKTSERDAVLTVDSLKTANAKDVKDCRKCHAQSGDDAITSPSVTYDGKAVKLTNKEAYHRNCNVCHDDALKARPELKAKGIPGSNDCGKCHVPLG